MLTEARRVIQKTKVGRVEIMPSKRVRDRAGTFATQL
jgi:hypothetical protein